MSSRYGPGSFKSFVEEQRGPSGGRPADGDGPKTEPTITAIWAALKVLQEDVQEMQREIFQGEDEE